MKANELSCKDLMVGDWVKPKNVDVSFRVGLIGADSVWNDTDTHEWYYDELEPIPLTAEILEKNGFKLNPQGSYSIGSNISIDMLDGRYNANMNTNNPQASSFLYQVGRYVHELQHALRLCGIEKEIIL